LQPQFVYDVHTAKALRNSVSSPRLLRYEAFATGDLVQALRLYTWNTALSEALYGPIQGLEITLRNKMNDCFASHFGPQWFDAPAMGLLYAQQDQVTQAKQALWRHRKAPDPDRVVAELSFGFWAGLFGRQYETHLWRRYLRALFVNAPSPFLRQDAHRVLNNVRMLRNRIAHHEPILHRPLQREYDSVLAAIGWLCMATAAWVGHHSRFGETFAARP